MSNVSQEELFSPDEHTKALRHSDSLPDDIENLLALGALVYYSVEFSR